MDPETITTAALQTLDEAGLEHLTMRAVAARLGVQVGGLYYHVPDKATLLRLMAERICAEILATIAPTADWRAGALATCETTRRILLEHRDGARIFAGAPLLGSLSALTLMEGLLDTLAQGIAAERVGTCADTLLSYLTGYVLQEQHEPPAGEPSGSIAELSARFPRILSGGGDPPDETFRASLEAILDGFTGTS